MLSIDEKSQIQALDRTQPGLPLKKGRCGTMTHDYIRHGTTTLFAALNVLDGNVLGRCMQRHRHQEFIRFLNAIEAAVPAGKLIHAIVDNYATHKHPKVAHGWQPSALDLPLHAHFRLLAQRRRGLLCQADQARLKRGVFRSVVELQAAIKRFLGETNQDPRPFRWTKDPSEIIAAVKRGHQVLNSIH